MSTIKKSEILFLYESKYSIPNGDPFTGEQRYDDESRRILVSDVRIKRFIRDYLIAEGRHDIYVMNDREQLNDESVTSAVRVDMLMKKYEGDPSIVTEIIEEDSVEDSDEEGPKKKAGKKEKKDKKKKGVNLALLLQKCIDVRLFGGISTKENSTANITGPVQFALLNPSLNAVDLRMHQNTSIFSSKTANTQGAIGTTTVVPYSLNQIHGWINPYVAEKSGLKQTDIDEMFRVLWCSINNANTRTKSNQSSVLLLQIVYKDIKNKIYGLDNYLKLKLNKPSEEQIRSSEDYEIDFKKLELLKDNEAIDTIFFYTEIPELEKKLSEYGFSKMNI